MTDNNELIERLKTEMRRKNINAKELAQKAGLGQSFVYDIINGKSANPTVSKLSLIASVLGISIAKLLEEDKVSYGKYLLEGEIVPVPSIIGLPARKGGKLYLEENYNRSYYFQAEWVKEKLNSLPENLRMIFMRGESMLPTFHDKDMILIDITRKAMENSGIFAVHDNLGIIIRRLQTIKNKPLKLEIVCDNKNYETYECLQDEITIIGQVVWFSRNLVSE